MLSNTISFFNTTYSANNEQNLYDSLLVESIQANGIDVLYIPRDSISRNEIYGEDISKFTTTFLIEMYVKDVLGFQGQGDLLSKFGLQMNDEMTFTVVKSRFKTVTSLERPYEGDIIYFPLNGKYFEIKHVEHESEFYKFNKLFLYDLKCELMIYNSEEFATSNTLIDVYEKSGYTVDLALVDGVGDYIQGEHVYQGVSYETANVTAKVVEWVSPTLTISNLTGEFVVDEDVIGCNSVATWTYANTANFDDDKIIFPDVGFADNYDIETNAEPYIESANNDNIFGIDIT